MATRVYCDHCGNTISSGKPNRFSFGPSIYFEAAHQAQQNIIYQQQRAQMINQYQYTPVGSGLGGGYTVSSGGGGGGANWPLAMAPIQGSGVQFPGSAAQSSNQPTIETIDLCDNCAKIWMARVRALCTDSNPA